MNKLIICTLIGLMMFTLVSAADNDYMGKQGMTTDIIETCSDDGFKCDSTYECNITITDPAQELIILNLPMTRNDTAYVFTLGDTDLLGVYKIKTYCGNGTFSGESVDGTLTITTTGTTTDTLKLIVILLISGMVLLLIAIFTKNRVIGFLSGMLITIAGMYVMIYGFLDFYDLYTRSIAGIIIALGGYLIISAGYEWIKDAD